MTLTPCDPPLQDESECNLGGCGLARACCAVWGWEAVHVWPWLSKHHGTVWVETRTKRPRAVVLHRVQNAASDHGVATLNNNGPPMFTSTQGHTGTRLGTEQVASSLTAHRSVPQVRLGGDRDAR